MRAISLFSFSAAEQLIADIVAKIGHAEAAVARLEKAKNDGADTIIGNIRKGISFSLSNALMQPHERCPHQRVRIDVLGAVVGNLQGVLEMTD